MGPRRKYYNLFISHSWKYEDQYVGLYNLLKSKNHFEFKDYSVPRDDPIHTTGTASELREAIRIQMAPCSVILILGGIYSTYSKWIQTEIDLANQGFKNPKPIVAVRPWRQRRISSVVRDSALRIVNWNSKSIVAAIRKNSTRRNKK